MVTPTRPIRAREICKGLKVAFLRSSGKKGCRFISDFHIPSVTIDSGGVNYTVNWSKIEVVLDSFGKKIFKPRKKITKKRNIAPDITVATRPSLIPKINPSLGSVRNLKKQGEIKEPKKITLEDIFIRNNAPWRI